jgi:putative addiction module component (TIGR02574 family)
MSAALEELLKLPAEDRLEAISVLWDSLDRDKGEFPLSVVERRELDRRIDAYERDPSGGYTLEEIIRELRQPK